MCKKKIIIVIIGLLFGVINVKATSNVDTSLSANLNNNDVLVTLKVAETSEGLDGLMGKIEYDEEKVEFVEALSANDYFEEPVFNPQTRKFTILIKSSSVVTPTDVVKFKFKVKKNKTGNIEFKITDLNAATSSDKKIYLNDCITILKFNNPLINKDDKTKEEVTTDKDKNKNDTETEEKKDNNVESEEVLSDSEKLNKDYLFIVIIGVLLVVLIYILKKRQKKFENN